MKLKSNKKFLDKCFEGKLTTTDVYTYTEKITEFDLQKLVLLKLDFLEYKKRIVIDKIEEIKYDPKFITMEMNKDHIPVITNLFIKQEETDDEKVHEAIFDAEVDEFCDEFLPGYFKHFNQAERIVRLKTDEVINKMLQEDEAMNKNIIESNLKWEGKPAEFGEWIKSAIEANCITGGTDEEIFRQFCKFLNFNKFSKKNTIQKLKDRGEDTIFLNKLIKNFTNWKSE